MVYLELFAGLVLLLGGAEALIRGAVAIALRLGVSHLLIGLTLVGYGTSTPELVASVEAAWIGSAGVAVGNVVGSNIANILLILGVSALIYPIATAPDTFRRDSVVLIGASLLLTAVVLTNSLSAVVGMGFLALLLAYTVFLYLWERGTPAAAPDQSPPADTTVDTAGLPLGWALALAVGGIAGVIFGATLLIGSAIEIATRLGVSETVIGLTLVAVGTSLPELATSVMAALRRQGDIAFGNVIGSNIYNILGILGVTVLVAPVGVPEEIARFDIWAMLIATGALVIFALSDWRISRREGAIFLGAYVAYIAFLLWGGGGAAPAT